MDTDRISGKEKELEGEGQQGWGRIKDAVRDKWEDVKEKAEDVGDEADDRIDERHEKDEETESAATR